MAWRVDCADAYDAWIKREMPRLPQKAHMSIVLDGWETTGPPNPVETYGGANSLNQVCIGPHGERIVYRVYETARGDEYEGIIFVLVIGPPQVL